MPPQPGTRLYALSKYLGQEICNKYSDFYDIKVITLLYLNMRHHYDLTTPDFEPAELHKDMTPFTTSWIDCGEAVKCAVDLELSKLDGNRETFLYLQRFLMGNLIVKKHINYLVGIQNIH